MRHNGSATYTVHFYLVGGSRGPFYSLDEAIDVGQSACFSFYVADEEGNQVYSWNPVSGRREVLENS